MLHSVPLLLAACVLAPRHPQDGPDCELRGLVGARGVELTVRLNLCFADELVGVLRSEEAMLYEDEAEELYAILAEYIAEHSTLRIDGLEVAPVLGESSFSEAELERMPYFPKHGARALTYIELGLRYPAKSTPRQVDLHWEMFPPNLAVSEREGAPAVEITGSLAHGPRLERFTLTVLEPGYTWTGDGTEVEHLLEVPPPPSMDSAGGRGLVLKVLAGLVGGALAARFALRALGSRAWVAGGALGALCAGLWARPAGPALPTPEEANEIFRRLHANVYRAFDYSTESEVYDALSRSVDEERLESLYAEVYEGLLQEDADGALSRVDAVRPLATEVAEIGWGGPGDRARFRIHTRWQVDGSVHHSGHAHYRTNEYEAEYDVLGTQAGWRIADHDVLASLRISSSTTDPNAIQPGPSPLPGDVPEEF